MGYPPEKIKTARNCALNDIERITDFTDWKARSRAEADLEECLERRRDEEREAAAYFDELERQERGET